MNNLNYFTKIAVPLLLLPALFLTGCSSRPETHLVPIQIDQIEQAAAWEMQGKLALKTAQDKFSTNLYWLHSKQEDKLRLTTMLGTSLLSLDNQPGGATLILDDKTYHADDAERLLLGLTGWSIPLDRLPLWITGQTAANDLVLSRDASSRPKVIQSSIAAAESLPWRVTFKSWQHQSGAELPRLLELTRGDLLLKIQINRWQALADKHSSGTMLGPAQNPQ